MGDNDGGAMFVGSKGILICGCYGRNPTVYCDCYGRKPVKLMDAPASERPSETIVRSPGIYKEWIRACKGGPPASSNFDVAGPLTEIALLGNLAMRFQDKHMPLEWNGEKMEVTNLPEANEFMRAQNHYRDGWSL